MPAAAAAHPSGTPDRLAAVIHALAEPLAAARDVDLLDVAVKGQGSRTRVQVVVDRVGGIDLATCQELSRAISRALDDADPLPSRYVLEVTSPGTDRPLSTRRDFERAAGRDVAVQYVDAADPSRHLQVRGRIERAELEAVVITTADGEVAVAYETIAKATQVLPW